MYRGDPGVKGSLQLRSASTLVVNGCVLFVCQT
jgi:hypothetical protein